MIESDDMEPNNSLLPPEVLEHLLGFLPVDSLRLSRLVNPNWAKAGVVPMRKKSATVSFRFEAGGRPRHNPYAFTHHEDIERFVACFKASNGNFPVSKFEVILSPYGSDSITTLDQFFKVVSPVVTELGLTFNLGHNHPIPCPGNAYPKLTSLKLKMYNYLEEKNFLTITKDIFDFIEEIIGQAPKLKMVSLEPDQGGRTVGRCLDAISGREGLLQRITHLHLDIVNMEESGFSKFNTFHGFKLKAVKLISGPRDLESQANLEIFKRFLESQADSLKALEILLPESLLDMQIHNFRLNIPPLGKLEYLKIARLISIEGLSTKNFAALKRLHLESPSPSLEELIMTSIAEGEPFSSVEELIISDTKIQTIEESRILLASPHFPNVTKLGIMPLTRKMFLAVCHGFPNLVELQFSRTSLESECPDSIITGLSEEQLKAAEMEMEAKGCLNEVYWRRKVDASKSIAVLQHLKVLTLLPQMKGLAEPLEFGIISSFVLKSMESLKLLHLGIRSFPPSDEHTNKVLQDLREKICVVYDDYEPPKVWVEEEPDDDYD